MRIFAGVNSPRIRRSRVSSNAFGTAILLCPDRSRALCLWWCVLHALPAAAVLLVTSWPILAAAIVAGLTCHALRRFPRQLPPVLLRRRDGSWSLPQRGITGLTLASGSVLAWNWVRLVLSDGRCRHVVLLVRDQIDSHAWRALQARLRQTF
jgi:hypothetical protein